MTTVHVHLVPADGSAPIELACKPGRSLMEAAVAANVRGIEAECGGLLTCATCHVVVREPHASRLPPPGDDELAMLAFTASPRQANSRLSCQLVVDAAMEGLVADLPPTQT